MIRSITVLTGRLGTTGDFLERLADKSLDFVLRNGEDLRVDGVVVFYGHWIIQEVAMVAAPSGGPSAANA